jgi:hypothetical protein
VCIPAEAIDLGDDELSAVEPACLDSLSQDGPIRLLPTLDLDELLDDFTIAAVEEVIYSLALRFEPEATTALSASANPQVRYPPAYCHDSPA